MSSLIFPKAVLILNVLSFILFRAEDDELLVGYGTPARKVKKSLFFVYCKGLGRWIVYRVQGWKKRLSKIYLAHKASWRLFQGQIFPSTVRVSPWATLGTSAHTSTCWHNCGHFFFVEFSQFPNRLSRKTNQKGMEEVNRYKKVPSPSWWGFMQIAVGKSLKREKHEKESEMGGDDLSLDCCCWRVGEVENSLSIGR